MALAFIIKIQDRVKNKFWGSPLGYFDKSPTINVNLFQDLIKWVWGW